MTKKLTIDEKVEVMLHSKHFTIQRQAVASVFTDSWCDMEGEPDWNWAAFNYRVKPAKSKTREFWINMPIYVREVIDEGGND